MQDSFNVGLQGQNINWLILVKPSRVLKSLKKYSINLITCGVVLFHDCPAPIRKPGQANTKCPREGWLLQCAVTLIQLAPPSLIAALAAA